MTRAMFVTVLGRVAGVEADENAHSSFGDVPDGQWYTNGVEWAASHDIVVGYGDGRYGPDDRVTREQLAAILQRYARYKGYEITLEPGDTLFLYTDGVPEAANKESTMFGTDRMIEALNVDPGADPETLIRIVRHSVDLFTGDATQFDDITMVCLRYKGCEKQV